MRDSDDVNALDDWQRYVFGAVGIGLLVISFVLARIAVATTSVAPDCAAPAPEGCVVQTSTVIDSALPIFALAAAVLFILMSVSGRIWTFKSPNGEFSPNADVAPASGQEVLTSEKSGIVEDVRVADGAAEAIAISGDRAVGETSVNLWETLDREIAYALDSHWRSWYGESVVDKITEVKRAVGKGNHAWFVRARDPDGTEIWARVTKGGRRGGSRAERSEPE